MSLDLDTVNKDAVIEELATALAYFMDGTQDHDIANATGCCDKDCKMIADARRLAEQIIGWKD